MISPSNNETFDALVDAVPFAVFPIFVAAAAPIEPVTTTDPDAGYA